MSAPCASSGLEQNRSALKPARDGCRSQQVRALSSTAASQLAGTSGRGHSPAPRLSHLIHGVSSTLPPLAVSICVDFTVALTGRANVTVYCDNKLLATLLSIASRPVGWTIGQACAAAGSRHHVQHVLTMAGRGRGVRTGTVHTVAPDLLTISAACCIAGTALASRELKSTATIARRGLGLSPSFLAPSTTRLDQHGVGLPVGEQPLNEPVERRRLAREVDGGDRRSGVLQDRNLRLRIAALDGRNKRREPLAIVLGRGNWDAERAGLNAGGRPNRIDEKGDEERLGRRPHIEHVARRPILAHDQVARTEVCDWPASFSDDGNQRGLSARHPAAPARPERRSQGPPQGSCRVDEIACASFGQPGRDRV